MTRDESQVTEPTSNSTTFAGANIVVTMCPHGLDKRRERCLMCADKTVGQALAARIRSEQVSEAGRLAADFALLYGTAYPKTYPDVLALEADLKRFLLEHTVVDRSKPCAADPRCYRYQGHDGDHLYGVPATPTGDEP